MPCGTGNAPARTVALLGPAVIISVGYVDPGNWATDLEAGSRFGYTLLWVLLAANLAALLLQHLSAKLGLATGFTYPELCRRQFPRPVVVFLWVTAELAAMATDLAEFLGAALGFYLLFHLPLFPPPCSLPWSSSGSLPSTGSAINPSRSPSSGWSP